MQVTVPPGAIPGMPFAVNTPAGQMQVTCPEGVSPGCQMIVNVPAAPTAAATAVAAPVPLVMGNPVSDAGSQTGIVMAQPASAAAQTQILYKMQLDEADCSKYKDPPSDVPYQLVNCGVGSSEWEACRTHILEHQRAIEPPGILLGARG